MSVWDTVVGHAEAVAALREAVAGGRVAHAWLFTGPPGVGKTYVARVFAAALNCPASGDGTCPACRKVLRGTHPDVHLIEPEGEQFVVDDVRAAREEAWRSRHEGRTAVFILAEADRMNPYAANALLKVLEEPPPAVVFVLVATSAEALVGTIPSRARVVAFRQLPPATVADALAAELGVTAEQAGWAAAASGGRLGRARALLTDEAARLRRAANLDLVERLASGRAGDALDAAAEVLARGEEAADQLKERHARELADLEETYGTARGSAGLRRRVETRQRRESRRARFETIREAVIDLLGAYRDLAVLASPGASAPKLVHADRAAALARAATRTSPAAALRAAAALAEADRRLAAGASPQLTLEAAFLAVQDALAGAPAARAR